jgi:hypothetical protein
MHEMLSPAMWFAGHAKITKRNFPLPQVDLLICIHIKDSGNLLDSKNHLLLVTIS